MSSTLVDKLDKLETALDDLDQLSKKLRLVQNSVPFTQRHNWLDTPYEMVYLLKERTQEITNPRIFPSLLSDNQLAVVTEYALRLIASTLGYSNKIIDAIYAEQDAEELVAEFKKKIQDAKKGLTEDPLTLSAMEFMMMVL